MAVIFVIIGIILCYLQGVTGAVGPVGVKGSRGEKGQKEVLVQGVRKDLTGNRVFLAIPVQLVQEVPRERKD
jgi:hypothetical protein